MTKKTTLVGQDGRWKYRTIPVDSMLYEPAVKRDGQTSYDAGFRDGLQSGVEFCEKNRTQRSIIAAGYYLDTPPLQRIYKLYRALQNWWSR